jgi:signal peptidase II
MPLLRTALSAVIAFGLDRLSKVVIIHWLNLGSIHVLDVWPPYLNLVMAWNTGVNFGLLSAYSRWALVALAIAISLVLSVWARNKRGWLPPLAIGVIIGGALSNAFDRVIYGAVADYLNMSCCGIENPYSFNVADIFVVCGGVLIVSVISRPSSRPRV